MVVDFCYHSSAYGLSRELYSQRADLDGLLTLLVMGEALGVPVLSHYYSRRLAPYLWFRLGVWKRHWLRPKGLGGW